jgi:hypothetical protein
MESFGDFEDQFMARTNSSSGKIARKTARRGRESLPPRNSTSAYSGRSRPQLNRFRNYNGVPHQPHYSSEDDRDDYWTSQSASSAAHVEASSPVVPFKRSERVPPPTLELLNPASLNTVSGLSSPYYRALFTPTNTRESSVDESPSVGRPATRSPSIAELTDDGIVQPGMYSADSSFFIYC